MKPATPQQAPSRPVLIAATLAMLTMGTLMLLHGLGLYDARWFNPNPLTPAWVFATLGTVLILGALLAAGNIRPLPRTVTQAIGYSLLALCLLVAHWLIFFAEGGSCSLSVAGFGAAVSSLLCRGIMGLALIVFDLILLLALFGTSRRSQPGA
jgi:hypothetical protein